MPLSPKELWLAEITAAGAPRSRAACATPGVGSTPDQHDVGTLGAQARDQRGLEHRARAARVAADHERFVAAEHAHSGATERGDQLRGELHVGDAAHPVGAESQRHVGHVEVRARLSASSTAAPCGPS